MPYSYCHRRKDSILTYLGVTAWGSMGNELDERMQFLEYGEFYENQPALPGAREFLISLMEKADVFIATAVYPEFIGERIQRIQTLFPEFPLDHIYYGQKKRFVSCRYHVG